MTMKNSLGRISDPHSSEQLLIERDKSPNGNMLLIDTKGLCLICFKPSSSWLHRKNDSTSAAFYRYLSKYIGTNFYNEMCAMYPTSTFLSNDILRMYANAERVGIDFPMCEDCTALSNMFGQTFQEYEVLRMKLNTYTCTLSGIMKSAEKVSSRFSTFKERIGMEPSTKNERGNQKNLTARTSECFRVEVIQKCLLKLKITSPQLVVAKCESPKRKIDSFCKGQEETFFLSLLGCTVSLWIVLSLSFLNTETFIEEQKKLQETSRYLAITYETPVGEIKTPVTRSGKNKHSPVEAPTPKKPKLTPQEPLFTTPCNTNKPKVIPKSIIKHLRKCTQKIVLRKVSIKLEDCLANKTSKSTPPKKTTPLVNVTRMPTRSFVQKSDNDVVTEENVTEPGESLKKDDIPTPKTKTSEVNTANDLQLVSDANATASVTDNDNTPPPNQAPVDGDFDKFTPFDLNFDPCAPTAPLTSQYFVPAQILHPCHICNQHFDSRAKLEKHRVVIHQLQFYVQCPTCGQMFQSYYNLELHRMQHLKCNINEDAKHDEYNDSARALFPYSRRVLGNKFCPFDNCFEVFQHEDQLETHLTAHGNFPCAFCSTRFEKGHDLALHEYHCLINNGNEYTVTLTYPQFKCSRCDFASNKQHQLTLHFLRDHLNIPAHLKCRVCNQNFDNKSELKVHKAQCHGVKNSLRFPTKIEPSVDGMDFIDCNLVKTEVLDMCTCMKCGKHFHNSFNRSLHYEACMKGS